MTMSKKNALPGEWKTRWENMSQEERIEALYGKSPLRMQEMYGEPFDMSRHFCPHCSVTKRRHPVSDCVTYQRIKRICNPKDVIDGAKDLNIPREDCPRH